MSSGRGVGWPISNPHFNEELTPPSEAPMAGNLLPAAPVPPGKMPERIKDLYASRSLKKLKHTPDLRRYERTMRMVTLKLARLRPGRSKKPKNGKNRSRNAPTGGEQSLLDMSSRGCRCSRPVLCAEHDGDGDRHVLCDDQSAERFCERVLV